MARIVVKELIMRNSHRPVYVAALLFATTLQGQSGLPRTPAGFECAGRHPLLRVPRGSHHSLPA